MGDRDVHGPLCCRIPASICRQRVCKNTIDKSGSLPHDHRCSHLVPLDSVLPRSRSKTPGYLPGNLRLDHPARTTLDSYRSDVIALPISLAVMIHR